MTTQKKVKDFYVKDIKLANQGKLRAIEALKEMPGLVELRKTYKNKKPLKGLRITGSVLVSYETANFIVLLRDLGASVRWCSDSLHYSLDDACAYIASLEIPIYAKRGLTHKEYVKFFEKSIKHRNEKGDIVSPHILIDDGAELTEYLLENSPNKINKVRAMLEQTTSGITLMKKKFINNGLYPFPIINVNASITKAKFDNIYGSRESLIDGLQNACNIQIAGKRAVVFGYGEVGKGCAQVLRGLGAHVSIVEINPIAAMQAHMEGYEILDKKQACKTCTIFVTATGCIKTIDSQDINILKGGAILMNMSEHDMEVNSQFFRNNKKLEKVSINEFCDRYEFPDGRHIYLLCDGYIVNLYAGQGHPPSVMGITFTNHTLALLDLVNRPNKYSENKIYRVPKALDEQAARLSFPEINKKLTQLTKEQKGYLGIVL